MREMKEIHKYNHQNRDGEVTRVCTLTKLYGKDEWVHPIHNEARDLDMLIICGMTHTGHDLP